MSRFCCVNLCAALCVVVGCAVQMESEKKKKKSNNAMALAHKKKRLPVKGGQLEGINQVVDLKRQLKSESPDTRATACKGLGDLGIEATSAARDLRDMAEKDKDGKVRAAAAAAYNKVLAAMKKKMKPWEIENFLKGPPGAS